MENTSSVIAYVYDNTAQFRKGKFVYYQEKVENNTILCSPPQAPKKAHELALLWQAASTASSDSMRLYPRALPNGEQKEFEEEKTLQKMTPGQDESVKISDTTTLPYSIYAKLEIVFKGAVHGGCGALVGPHHLLTCARNVYDIKEKIWASKITAYFTERKSVSFSPVKVTRAYIFTNWANQRDEEFDIALLILNRSIGLYTGWGGLLSTNDHAIENKKIHVIGYPKDTKFNDEIWSMSRIIKKISPESFIYGTDTSMGQSGGAFMEQRGSAVWISEHALPLIIGVHTLGCNVMNLAVRISNRKFISLFVDVISETYKIQKKPDQIAKPLLSIREPQHHFKLIDFHPSREVQDPTIQSNSIVSIPPPAIAFGKAKWKAYFGDIGEEPSLPADIHQILDAPCPFWPNEKVQDTHMLVLIPKTVDGQPLTLNNLVEWIKTPKQGYATQFSLLEPHGNAGITVTNSYWVLMTRDVLDGTRTYQYSDQTEILSRLCQKTKIPYEVPKLLEAAVCILMRHVSTGVRLYSDNPCTYTNCQEEWSCYEERGFISQLKIGSFSARGLTIHGQGIQRTRHDGLGLSCLRKF